MRVIRMNWIFLCFSATLIENKVASLFSPRSVHFSPCTSSWLKPSQYNLWSLSKHTEVSLKVMWLLSAIFLNLLVSPKRNISTQRKMAIVGGRRKQTLFRQQWLQDAQEWQQVFGWIVHRAGFRSEDLPWQGARGSTGLEPLLFLCGSASREHLLWM